jgi:peroxiredoxin Q/BCP
VAVVAIGPDDGPAFQRYFTRENLPFEGIPDPGGRLLGRLGQEVNWLRLGRMPALLAVDATGRVVHVHKGRTMADLPDFGRALAALRPGADPTEPVR